MKRTYNILSLRHQFQNRKGLTLIELILGIGLLSIILSSFFSIINISTKYATFTEIEDEILLNGRFAIDYLKGEMEEANKIIPSDKIEGLNALYPKNIGFVIMTDSGIVNSLDRYNFITYYINEKNELVRIARHSIYESYPKAKDLSGYNVICEYIISFDGIEVDSTNKLIKLCLNMGKDEKIVHNFKSMIHRGIEYDF